MQSTLSPRKKRVLLVPISLIIAGCSGPPPTDKQLTEKFEKEQAAFLQLKEKLCQSGEKRIIMMDPEWSKPQVPDTERAAYYTLFKTIGASGVYYDGNCSFRVPVWSVGFAGGGDYKGYSYRPQEYWRGNITDRPLDEIDQSVANRIFASKLLQNDWYIYFQHWP